MWTTWMSAMNAKKNQIFRVNSRSSSSRNQRKFIPVSPKVSSQRRPKATLRPALWRAWFLLQNFKCADCGKIFKSKQTCIDHVRPHTGDLFKCDKCDKGFIARVQLRSHTCTERSDSSVPCARQRSARITIWINIWSVFIGQRILSI